MHSLFDEIKNPLFSLIFRLVNEIYSGKKITRTEIKNRIRKLPSFFYNETPDFKREEEIIDAVFSFDEKTGFAKNCIDAPISVPVTDSEISWLKTFLIDDETAFLLPENLREKLLERLKNVKLLYEKNIWRKLNFKQSKPREGLTFAKNLSSVIQALVEQKIISAGEQDLIPYRLEYDNFADKYFLVTWSEKKTCVEKIPIADLSNLTLSNKKIPSDVEEKVKKFYSENSVEISLLVQNTRNAVERCFAVFGAYDKKAWITSDGKYFLTIKFLKFDEEEILARILFLGVAVTVVSPESYRQKVIDIFSAIQ